MKPGPVSTNRRRSGTAANADIGESGTPPFVGFPPCPGLTDHPTGAMDMLLSQNEEPSEIFNSRQVPWSNS